MATGGTTQNGEEGYGVSCDQACATAAAGECDADAFDELDSEENFNLAKPDAMSCDMGYVASRKDYAPYTSSLVDLVRCFFRRLQGSSTCGSVPDGPSQRRLCPCQCGAGSYQPLPGIAQNCTRYVPIAVGGTQREPFFHAPSTPRRNRSRAARWLPPC